MSASPLTQSLLENEDSPPPKDKGIEIHGRKGFSSRPFRKSFPNRAAFDKWMEKHGEDVTIDGTRDAED